MATINQFEQIDAWQKARNLTRDIYQLANRTPFSNDYALRNQICRASVSIMANIAEGFERGGDKEFHQFLALAKASAAEVRSHLYVALDAQYINESEFDALSELTREVGRMIGGMMRYLRQSDYKGNKFT